MKVDEGMVKAYSIFEGIFFGGRHFNICISIHEPSEKNSPYNPATKSLTHANIQTSTRVRSAKIHIKRPESKDKSKSVSKNPQP